MSDAPKTATAFARELANRFEIEDSEREPLAAYLSDWLSEHKRALSGTGTPSAAFTPVQQPPTGWAAVKQDSQVTVTPGTPAARSDMARERNECPRPCTSCDGAGPAGTCPCTGCHKPRQPTQESR